MPSQSSRSAVGTWEWAHPEDGGGERVAGVCSFLKILKMGWRERRKNTIFSEKERLGFFLPFLHLIIFFLSVQCSAALLLLQPSWDLPLPPCCLPPGPSLLSTSSPQLGRSLWGKHRGPQGVCRQRSSPQGLPASSWQLCAPGSVRWSHQNTDAAELLGWKTPTGVDHALALLPN